MSIKIHHGPNGSYKTSGAIQDDAVPALKEGRVIITNVRGFTLERVLQVMPEIPQTVEIINLDLESIADQEKMRCWFQWAPRGAFIIFDETQIIFPKAWRDKDLNKFDFPGGPEAAAAADRPMSWLDGWTRHRHWNWDIVLTTPNISYIRDDIRMTCEMAYKHSNLAIIGVAGRYKEAQHDAQLNRAPADGTIIEYKKIKPDTFKLYQSTATGKTQDTKAGKSLLKSPKLLFLLAFLALLAVFAVSLGTPSFGPAGSESAASKTDSAPHPQAPMVRDQVPDSKAGSSSGGNVVLPAVNVAAAPLDHPYAPRTFNLKGVLSGSFDGQSKVMGMVEVVNEDGTVFRQSFDDLEHLGYQISVRGNCLVTIRHPLGYSGQMYCMGKPSQRDNKGNPVELAGLNVGGTMTSVASAVVGGSHQSGTPGTQDAMSSRTTAVNR